MNGGPKTENTFFFEVPTIMCDRCISDIKSKLMGQTDTVTNAEITKNEEEKYILTVVVNNPHITEANIIQFIKLHTIRHHDAATYNPAAKKRFGM